MSTAVVSPVVAAAVAAVAAQKVHVEVPGFIGFGEFHGSNVDCSADAELMARHPLDGTPTDAATLNATWSDYLSTGHGDHNGATLDDIYWHLTASAHKLDVTKARVVRYIPLDHVALADLRVAIIGALVRGQTVIVFLGLALALPDNEGGVHGHFIALGGVDSDLGYLVGNGDEAEALGGHGIIPTHWVGWKYLAAAQINGMIALERVTTPASAVPTGWHDDGATLTAPNGVVVVSGFRSWTLAHAWDANNTPIAAEYGATDGSGDTRLDFLYSSLVWRKASNTIAPAQLGLDYHAATLALAGALAAVNPLKVTLAQIAALASGGK